MNKDLLEKLLAKTIATLIKQNGGSMEQALDDIGVQDTKDRKLIKNWFDWEGSYTSYIVTITKKNYNLDTEEIIFEYENDCSDATNNRDAVIETLRIALGGAEEEN